MRQTIGLRSGGLQRRYAVAAADIAGSSASSAPTSGPLPLVVQLHGRGIDAVRFDLWTGIATLGERAGFATVMPWALDGIWNDGRFAAPAITEVDDVGFVAAVIEDVGRRIAIDPARVYVVGMSNGATMTARLAAERPELVAAIAQVAGTAGVDVAERGRSAAPLPILHLHGTADRLAPYDGGVVQGIGARLLLGRRRAGPVVGVDEWARCWVERNAAARTSTEQRLPPDVTVHRWSGATPSSDVVFYRIDGGGHTWPGQHTWTPPYLGRRTLTIDATALILDFFREHGRATPVSGPAPAA